MLMMRSLMAACVVSALSACQSSTPPSPPPSASPAVQAQGPFDVLITNGIVVDGTGAPWFRADVGIMGDRIAAIGQLGGREARTRSEQDHARRDDRDYRRRIVDRATQ